MRGRTELCAPYFAVSLTFVRGDRQNLASNVRLTRLGYLTSMANQEIAENKPSAVRSALDRPIEYLRDTRGELMKVKWPTRLEARNLTTVVLVTLFAMALVLGTMDAGFERLIVGVVSLNIISIAIMVVIVLAIAVLVLFASRDRKFL